MSRHPAPHIRTERIKYLVEFLDKGGGNKQQLEQYINSRLMKNNCDPVARRTIEADLEHLNAGDFQHSLSHLNETERSKLFRYEFKNKKYCWGSESQRPVFNDLDDDERLTLPFLFGLLKRYETIPAVQKILDVIEENYNMSDNELNKDDLFVVHNITMADSDFEVELMQVVLKLIGHIQRSEVIEFGYSWVGNLDNHAKENYDFYKIAPLQVKLYENYYYLTGINLTPGNDEDEEEVKPKKSGKIVNFRVDHIIKLQVDAALDETETGIETFDRQKLIRHTGFKGYFKHVLGVWTPSATDDVHRITIEFKDWAASYVKHLKFHPTQRFVGMDPKKNTYTISLDLKLMPEITKNGKKVTERAPELQFLLGRFRECAKIIKTERI
jgi:hypothetical protein